MTELLVARALTRHYPVSRGLFRPRATVKALDGVDLVLPPAHTLAVVGESGCGKSTLARLLTLAEPPTSGTLALDGVDVSRLGGAELKAVRRRIQMVFQNPYTSLNPRRTVGAQLAEPLAIHTGLTRAERGAEVAAMLARVGLRPEHAERYPHMFSGGQRQRIAIARAMMLGPGVVVADEPTSALDVSIQAQVLNLFRELQDTLGTAYVFISHNLAVVEHIADSVMVMYLGRVVETGDKASLFARPLHPYTRALMSATPSLPPAPPRARIRLVGEPPSPLSPPAGCPFHPRCPHATARCAAEVPLLRPLDGREVACHHAETLAD